ncbi:MAG: hypothetical protein ACRCT8_17015 [Lacipirellulaceae bacterium]
MAPAPAASWTNGLRRAGLAATLVGAAIAGFGAVAPDVWLRSLSPAAAGWTAERAAEHQEASAELHRLSFAKPDNQPAQQRLRDARLDFAETGEALRTASEAAGRLRGVLRLGGAAAFGVGLAALAVSRGASDR